MYRFCLVCVCIWVPITDNFITTSHLAFTWGHWTHSGMSICPSGPGCLSWAFCPTPFSPTHNPYPSRWRRRAVQFSLELILVGIRARTDPGTGSWPHPVHCRSNPCRRIFVDEHWSKSSYYYYYYHYYYYAVFNAPYVCQSMTKSQAISVIISVGSTYRLMFAIATIVRCCSLHAGFDQYLYTLLMSVTLLWY